jgi:hypothetical protein
MSYRQYTKCANIGSFVGFTWVQYVMAGGAAVVAAALTVLLGGAFVPALMVGVLSAIIAYCLWWLYDRLICLGGDICIVGFVLSVETPDEKSGLDSYDTDYSLNLVLPPNLVGASRASVETSQPFGKFMKKQSDITNYSFAGYHLPFSGNLVTKFSTGDPYGGQFTTDCMHAELEGGGVYDLLQACYAALALAAAAAAVCAVPIFGWIACIVLSLASGLVTLGGIMNALNDTGNPTDVNPNLTSIHAADAPDGSGADILLVAGTWVYDSAHEGWNEIHPIKQCQKIGSMLNQQWKEIQIGPAPRDVLVISDIRAFAESWCTLLGTANDPVTIANQQLPENKWQLHPLVDGCQPTNPAPPPIR